MRRPTIGERDDMVELARRSPAPVAREPANRLARAPMLGPVIRSRHASPLLIVSARSTTTHGAASIVSPGLTTAIAQTTQSVTSSGPSSARLESQHDAPHRTHNTRVDGTTGSPYRSGETMIALTRLGSSGAAWRRRIAGTRRRPDMSRSVSGRPDRAARVDPLASRTTRSRRRTLDTGRRCGSSSQTGGTNPRIECHARALGQPPYQWNRSTTNRRGSIPRRVARSSAVSRSRAARGSSRQSVQRNVP
jgi:hypothetical protein